MQSVVDFCKRPYNHNFTSSDFQSGRICFVLLVMKKEGRAVEQFLSFRLYIGSFPCAQLVSYQDAVHTARLLGRVFFCVFSLGLCFVCSLNFVFFICLYVPILLCFPEQLSHLPYSFWR